MGDAAFLKLGNDSERGIFIIVYQIDTFVRRNLNDFIQEHVVENAVAGELQNGGVKGKRKGFHGADAWKKDALVSPEERGVCGLLSQKGIEGEIFTEHGVKIRLKFGKHSFPGRNDQYVAKLLFSVHKGTSFPAKKW